MADALDSPPFYNPYFLVFVPTVLLFFFAQNAQFESCSFHQGDTLAHHSLLLSISSSALSPFSKPRSARWGDPREGSRGAAGSREPASPSHFAEKPLLLATTKPRQNVKVWPGQNESRLLPRGAQKGMCRFQGFSHRKTRAQIMS